MKRKYVEMLANASFTVELSSDIEDDDPHQTAHTNLILSFDQGVWTVCDIQGNAITSGDVTSHGMTLLGAVLDQLKMLDNGGYFH